MKKEMNKKVLFISGGALLCFIAILSCILLFRPSYKVSFNSKGGTAVEEQIVKSGGKAKEPEAPVKKGYTFKHWETAEGKEYSFKTRVKKDMTLKAVWQANEYTLTYNTDGGEPLEGQTVKYGKSFNVEIPVKSGYEFMGWKYEDADFEAGIWEYDKDITIDAQWIVEGSGIQASYTVRLIAERFDGSYNDVTDLYAKNYGLTGLKGSVGSIVDLRNRIKALAPPNGYIYDADKSNLVGEVQADGLLELVVCYSYKISLSATQEILEGEQVDIKLVTMAKLSPSDVNWSSSNKKVATIKDGVLTALSKGKTVITAKYKDQTAKCEVTVFKKTTLSLPKKEELYVGGTVGLTLNATEVIVASEVTWTSSNKRVATVSNGLITAVAGGETTITAKYRGQSVACTVTVYDASIANEQQFLTIYNDLSGCYKVTSDIRLTSYHASARENATFTGLIDFGGHTITVDTKTGSGTPYAFRLFFNVNGGTIRNGHLVSVSGYGEWGAAIADQAINTVTENITADVILNSTQACRNMAELGTKRNAGGLYNYVNGGSVKSCVVNVTIPSNVTVASGRPITNISAIGQVNSSAPILTECKATLTNKHNDQGIHLLAGHPEDVLVVNTAGDTGDDSGSGSGGEQEIPVSFTITGKNETKIGQALTLQLDSNVVIPATEVTWTSSDTAVATVANGVVTPVKKGVVTITATYKGKSATCKITVYTKYITTEAEFRTIYDDLSGYYKVTTDVTLTAYHASARENATFTGLLDFGGHTFTVNTKTGSGTPYAFRLFFNVNGGTIRNGHLVAVSGYGEWGAAIADQAINAVTENITADVILNSTQACRNMGEQSNKRNAGGLYNYVNGGTVKSCVVNVTIPTNLAVASGKPITAISAIGKMNGSAAITLTDCRATLVNHYNNDSIQLLSGHTNNVNVTDTAISGN